MSNVLSNEKWACEITTSSTSSSSSIGLYSGVFRFVSGGYVPSITDSFEVGEELPSSTIWNTTLLSKSGIGSLGSKINIISGGDYAFQKNSSVKLVNITDDGDSIHKVIDSIEDLSVSGAKMTIYCIINGVWHSRFSGIVGAKSFSDTTYTFIGADKNSNSADTLNNTVIGLINAETTYNPVGDIRLENLIAYRFDEDSRVLNQQTAFSRIAGYPAGESATRTPHEAFGGVGFTAGLFMPNQNNNRTIQYITPTVDGVSVYPVNGDVLKFNSDSTLHTITNVIGRNSPSKGLYTTVITIDTIDTSSTDYTFLFGDSYDDFSGDIHNGFETIRTKEDGEKCYFTLYHPVADTGIDANSIEDDGVITVISEEGAEYNFPYIKNSLGGIVITKSKSTSQIKPVKTQYFSRQTDIFASPTENADGRGAWGDFEQIISSEVVLVDGLINDMNPTSPCIEFGEPSDENSVFHYFFLTFDNEDVQGRDELQLGTLMKGVFSEDGQAWSSPPASPQTSMYYMSMDYHNGDTPTHQSTRIYKSATECASGQNQYFEVQSYTIVVDATYGRIPVLDKTKFLLPNLNDTGFSGVDDYGDSSVRASFLCSSVPATNVPMYSNGVVCVNNPQFTWKSQDYWNQKPMFPEASINTVDPIDVPKGKTTQMLVSVRAFTAQDFILAHSAGTPADFNTDSTDMADQQRLQLNLNGFCLFDTFDASGAEVDLTYRADDNSGSSNIVSVLRELTNDEGDYSDINGKDDWIAGLQVKEQTQRYELVTKLCKQSFIAGYTSRYGVDTYKSFPDEHGTPTVITNDIAIRGSIKDFSSSSASTIFNEFKITGDFETVEIKNVTEPSFPLFGEDFSDYVTGITNYYTARDYWQKARQSFVYTGVIHKLSQDRSKLDFATHRHEFNTFSENEQVNTAARIGLEPFVVGGSIATAGTPFPLSAYVTAGDTAMLYNSAGDELIEYFVQSVNEDVDNPFYNWTFGIVLSMSLTGGENSFDYDMSTSYNVTTSENNTLNKYRDGYLSLLLDWSTLPKLRTRFKLPITTDTIKHEIMDEVNFSDPLITPDYLEYGRGWFTDLSFDPNTAEISCEVTFDVSFFMAGNETDVIEIVEKDGNVDEIIEDETNVDEIIEGVN